MLDNISILLIFMGFTLFLVVLYYNKILSNLLSILTNLLQLQETRESDIQEYINSISYKLKTIGIDEIFYNLSYLKKNIQKVSKDEKLIIIKKDITYKNIVGEIAIGVQNNRGENKLVNKLILYVITLQIVNAIYSDIDKLNESFERIAKLQTYMVHDLKNILQFFQAMQYNLEHIHTDEEKKKFIDFLQISTTPIDKKVNKILALLQVKSNLNTTMDIKEIDTYKLIQEYTNYYNLPCHIQETPKIIMDEESLRVILDNIFSNIKDKTYLEDNVKCYVNITKDDTYISIEISDNGTPYQNPKKIFEPFYTTKENGIGIGMYHVSTVIEGLGGTICCQNRDNKPHVNIQIPSM